MTKAAKRVRTVQTPKVKSSIPASKIEKAIRVVSKGVTSKRDGGSPKSGKPSRSW